VGPTCRREEREERGGRALASRVGRKSELGSRGGSLGRWEKEKEGEEESGPRLG
jgi:hypothetical protein